MATAGEHPYVAAVNEAVGAGTPTAFLCDSARVPADLVPPRVVPKDCMPTSATADTLAGALELNAVPMPPVVVVGINDPDVTMSECMSLMARLRDRNATIKLTGATNAKPVLPLFLVGPSSRLGDPMDWRRGMTAYINAVAPTVFRDFAAVVLLDPAARTDTTPEQLEACMQTAMEHEHVFLHSVPVLASLLMRSREQGQGTRLEIGGLSRHVCDQPFVVFEPADACGAQTPASYAELQGAYVTQRLLDALRCVAQQAAHVSCATVDPYGNPVICVVGVMYPSFGDIAAEAMRVKLDDARHAVIVIIDTHTPLSRDALDVLLRFGFVRMPNPSMPWIDHWVMQPSRIPDLVPPAATSIRGSHVVTTCVYNARRMVLVTVQERRGSKALELAGGGVDFHEDHAMAAVREVREETRVDADHYPQHTLSVLQVEGIANARPDGIGDVMVFFHLDLGEVAALPAAGASHETLAAFWTDGSQLAETGKATCPADSVEYALRFSGSLAHVRAALAGKGIPVDVRRGEKRSWRTVIRD